MKKILALLFAVLFVQTAYAQFRIEAGGAVGSFENGYFFIFRSSSDVSAAFGFDANASYNIHLNSNEKNSGLSIAPGVGYLMNNVRIKGKNAKMRTQWIQVPVNLVVDIPIGVNDIGFTASAGLYYGYALNGKIIDPAGELNGVEYINAPTGERLLKRHDFGLNAKVGMMFTKNIGFYIGYSRGFLDISDVQGYIARTYTTRFGLILSL